MNRAAGGKHRILRHVPDARAFAYCYGTAVGVQATGEDLEQRRFTGAIGPHQADVIPLVQCDVEGLE